MVDKDHAISHSLPIAPSRSCCAVDGCETQVAPPNETMLETITLVLTGESLETGISEVVRHGFRPCTVVVDVRRVFGSSVVSR